MKSIKIPWGCWQRNPSISLTFPNNWKVVTALMADASDVGQDEIRKAFADPVGSERIRKLAEGKKTAVIAVDDLTRPTQARRFLPFVIKELNEAGIKDEDIRILLAIGCHRPMMKPDQLKKLGKAMANRFPVYNHHPYENLVDIGTTSKGTPLKINRFFMEADVKIGIGFITPHPSAGFGGGGKIVVPGLSGIDTIERNHAPSFAGIIGGTGFSEGHDVGQNELRQDMEEGARIAGLNFIVNSVGTSIGKTAGVFTGDPVKAHRAAVELGQRVYLTEAPDEADIGVFNAFPEDIELHHAQKALNVWRGNMDRRLVREGGKVVVATASPDGLGFHSHGDRGTRIHRKADRQKAIAEMFRNRKVVFFAPPCSRADLLERYAETVIIRNTWEDVLAELKEGSSGQTVTVFPNGSLQLLPMP
jgi:lactate racemase